MRYEDWYIQGGEVWWLGDIDDTVVSGIVCNDRSQSVKLRV